MDITVFSVLSFYPIGLALIFFLKWHQLQKAVDKDGIGFLDIIVGEALASISCITLLIVVLATLKLLGMETKKFPENPLLFLFILGQLAAITYLTIPCAKGIRKYLEWEKKKFGK